ncbi:hypothetical protein LO762_04455 [Actinocorallia sp. API 0066]|uniref:hypothetical protein n=1 Tax=Actinocorallia sp. API 0066 TaxID=2896846 RepID=UPI001E4159C7|nr:hypothetical protein [Actinocorallia sp. API 0066]MCD0448450.1 hypothetical protein [Actinocorallia sp. API 0066]
MTDTLAPPSRRREPGPRRRRARYRRRGGALGPPRTVPAVLRIWTAAVALALVGLFAAVHSGVDEAREGLRVIGRDAGPQAVNTGTLYLALSDMDAQLAGILLIGREHRLGQGRAKALAIYEKRRREAGQAVLQAFDIAGQNATGRETVQSVLDGLGAYERLAARALVLDERAGHRAGPPPAPVLAVYRQATDLMRAQLLPQAYNLTLESAAIVRRTHVSETDRATDALARVAVAGVVLLGVLGGLQVTISRRFRRAVSPPLALATAVALAITALAATSLGRSSAHLRAAKEDGFDSALTYARARAISNTAAADQVRWLIDPARADTYEQVYFDTSQTIAYVPAGNLAAYYTALEKVPLKGGFLQSTKATDPVVVRYRAFQKADRTLRGLAGAGRTRHAIVLRTGTMVGVYADYDRELGALVARGRTVFDDRITRAERALGGWGTGLPVGAAAVLALVLLGVRPRLAEFR